MTPIFSLSLPAKTYRIRMEKLGLQNESWNKNQKYLLNPRKLFLADSLGALLTAFMLGFVLTQFESIFGMPQKILYKLAFIAGIFCVYSFLCFLLNSENWRFYMKIIAAANLIYCCITMALVIFLHETITLLGVIYFVLEVIVVVILSVIELRTASN